MVSCLHCECEGQAASVISESICADQRRTKFDTGIVACQQYVAALGGYSYREGEV